MTTREKQPHRLVASDGAAWMLTRDGYTSGYNQPPRTLDDLRAEFPDLRPVEPISDEDAALLREVFARTGRKTVGTLAAALEQLHYGLRESRGGLANIESADYAERTLIAGRPGSWESTVLREVIWFGNTLNLAGNRGRPVDERRAAGPNPKRVDVECRQALVDVLARWVTGPDRYVEVAATLAEQVSSYADDTFGPDGWREIADQWLQPGGLAHQDAVTCYKLFYSVSAHFNPAVL